MPNALIVALASSSIIRHAAAVLANDAWVAGLRQPRRDKLGSPQ